MGKLALIFAFVPAGVLYALRAYFRAHPPDSSEVGFRGLQRGLRLGAVSGVALPLVCILLFFRPVGYRGNLLYLVCALAGNIVNFAGLIDCLREVSGESLVSAFLLIFIQLLWVWYAFMALMVAN